MIILQILLELDRVGILVVSAAEPWLDTGGPVRSLLIAIFSWVAEQERLRLIERTRAGLDRARRQGKRLGRPRARIDLSELLSLRAQGFSIRAAARKMRLGATTLHSALVAHRARFAAPASVPNADAAPLDATPADAHRTGAQAAPPADAPPAAIEADLPTVAPVPTSGADRVFQKPPRRRRRQVPEKT